ncbi:MAG: acyl-CoA dehydrogenase family protein [Deltaproteobacteria bacterium]|nr:acyl-CoA dehydrogenase family protein [Deltaproteobacteria bacterium]
MEFPPFTPEHEIFRKSVRDYVTKELTPHAREWDEAGIFPVEVFRQMGKLGFLGLRHPESSGGAGVDYWYTVAFGEELIRSRLAGMNMAIMVQTDMATPVLSELGTDDIKKDFVAPAIRGEKIAALGVTEPGCGSDVASIRTTARKEGGDYVINGSKTFITNGTRADFVTLAVRTGDAGHMGISLVVLPTDVKGFSVTRKLQKLGNHSSDTAELAFDNCRIPQRYLVGEENHGFRYIMMNFQGERLIAAITAVAGSLLALEDAVRYGRDRQAFGRPIIKFQVWRHELTDLYTQVEAARWLTYRACDLFNRGKDAVKEISMAKLYAGETVVKVMDRVLQFHGGYGYMDEYDISRAWRDSRLITIGGGTSEVMKEIISKWMGIG